MCGRAGSLQMAGHSIPAMSSNLEVMRNLISHSGPDGKGIWIHSNGNIGFAHRRLSIVDLK